MKETKNTEDIKENVSAKTSKEVKTAVVENLPAEPMRKVLAEDGSEYNLVTRDEALSEILETIRLLKKGLL